MLQQKVIFANVYAQGMWDFVWLVYKYVFIVLQMSQVASYQQVSRIPLIQYLRVKDPPTQISS